MSVHWLDGGWDGIGGEDVVGDEASADCVYRGED